jgi:hypothetical protein
LQVARLRSEAVRLGIREVNVAKGPGFGGPSYVVRLAPITLKVSQEVRLKRLVKDSVYKPEAQQLQLPVRKSTDLVEGLLTLLRDLVPPGSPANVDTP